MKSILVFVLIGVFIIGSTSLLVSPPYAVAALTFSAGPLLGLFLKAFAEQ